MNSTNDLIKSCDESIDTIFFAEELLDKLQFYYVGDDAECFRLAIIRLQASRFKLTRSVKAVKAWNLPCTIA